MATAPKRGDKNPTNKHSFGKGSRPEFGTKVAGTVGGGKPSSKFSNRTGGGEFATVKAGGKS